MVPDFELLERWRAGDRVAGNALFDRHFKAVYRFFRNKASSNVDDLVQKTFLACVEARDRFAGHSSFRTYIFAIARNLLCREFDARAREAKIDYSTTSLHDLGPSPTGLLAHAAEERLLVEALRRIPLDYQLVLELYYFERLSGPELSAALEIPEPTVRSRIRRGLERLRTELGQLAASPELLRSTVQNLDRWAESLREHLHA